jgi:hypothetical protein
MALYAQYNRSRQFRKSDAVDGSEPMTSMDVITAVENGDEAALLRLVDKLDDAIEDMKSELRSLRLGVVTNMTPDARQAASAAGLDVWRNLGRAEEARMAVGKSIADIRQRNASRSIAKSRGSKLADLQAEQRQLRKCADEVASGRVKLDEPMERKLRLACSAIEIEIAELIRK